MKLKFTYKIIIIAAILLVLFILFPTVTTSGLDSVFNAVTFIFGVLYGFEISIVLGNFTSLKTNLAQLNAQLRSVYNSARTVSPEAAIVISDKIENYLMKSIDVDLVEHYKTEKEFTEFIEFPKDDAVIKATMEDADAQGIRMQFAYQGLYDSINTRNQIEQVAPKFIEFPEWLMLGVLAFILVAILFLQRGDNIISTITSAILATAIIGSLIILDDIDSNDLQEGFLEYQVFNNTLTQIGKQKYYPDYAIKDKIVTVPKGTNYRLGTFPKYPNLDIREVKEIKI